LTCFTKSDEPLPEPLPEEEDGGGVPRATSSCTSLEIGRGAAIARVLVCARNTIAVSAEKRIVGM
jgi:hypothetical protein